MKDPVTIAAALLIFPLLAASWVLSFAVIKGVF